MADPTVAHLNKRHLAILDFDCPSCGAKAGVRCRRVNGEARLSVHRERFWLVVTRRPKHSAVAPAKGPRADRETASKRATELWEQGETYGQIAAKLAADGLTTSAGTPYQSTAVKALLWDWLVLYGRHK